ncbi:MAG TPA: hypothetical protein PLC89_03185 [Haliscomenobacter sp.]|uniref:PGAP1-like alpha/beta domain-containing protein n=1 Tax=Haliscomenobacter sp. TaxID=2717303 RepID=UPI002CC27408|nr:hypothetical protein [Haliscomenobacter sp.]HOY16264.1 hypothetical protein [Haliscomenobacter sp.]
MKLIFVHGRAQEGYDPNYLKKLWTDTLIIGLKKSGLVLPPEVKIEFPYYGKLLKDVVDEIQARPKQTVATRSGDSSGIDEAAEIDFFTEFLGEIAAEVNATPTEKAEIRALQEKTRGPLNWEFVQKMLIFLDKKQVFGDTVIKNVTRDVFLYLTINQIKKRINEEVEKCFDSAEPCVVVGHSMGSIVSYLILKRNPQYQVQKLITVGSPLGVTAVRKYLGSSIAMPECIKNGWFNAYDDRDYVALNPLDREYFNIKPPIENKRDVNNHTKGRHSIDGYLNDATVAKTIYDALMSI